VEAEGEKHMLRTGYLTSGEAARLIGISKITLLRAVKRGEIAPAMRTPGGCLRFSSAAVEEFTRKLSFAPLEEGESTSIVLAAN
jgi:excisionase family DNA binding protein